MQDVASLFHFSLLPVHISDQNLKMTNLLQTGGEMISQVCVTQAVPTEKNIKQIKPKFSYFHISIHSHYLNGKSAR